METKIDWDIVEAINIGWGLLIGIGLSWYTASIFEKHQARRKRESDKSKYEYLKSVHDKFDWQQWNISSGEIASEPIKSFMKIKYEKENILSYEWINHDEEDDQGTGTLIMDDQSRGKLYYYQTKTIRFDYRNFVYTKVTHQDIKYEGLAVNADDENSKYIMLRVLK